MNALREDDDELDLLLVHLTQTAGRGMSGKSEAEVSGSAAERSTHSPLSWVDAVCKEFDDIPDLVDMLMFVVLMSVVRPHCENIKIMQCCPVDSCSKRHCSLLCLSLE